MFINPWDDSIAHHHDFRVGDIFADTRTFTPQRYENAGSLGDEPK